MLYPIWLTQVVTHSGSLNGLRPVSEFDFSCGEPLSWHLAVAFWRLPNPQAAARRGSGREARQGERGPGRGALAPMFRWGGEKRGGVGVTKIGGGPQSLKVPMKQMHPPQHFGWQSPFVAENLFEGAGACLVQVGGPDELTSWVPGLSACVDDRFRGQQKLGLVWPSRSGSGRNP